MSARTCAGALGGAVAGPSFAELGVLLLEEGLLLLDGCGTCTVRPL